MPRRSDQRDGSGTWGGQGLPGQPGSAHRRRYDHYCGAARALDVVGDRWTLLIVRELLAGPRRYTDLHTDLPGVSTDVLASRLRDMEREGVTTRRKLARPASAAVYELTERGRGLLPVVQALYAWGAPGLAERRPTDAVRAHWFALPLRARLGALDGAAPGLVEVHLDDGVCHLYVGDVGDSPSPGPVYGDGPAPQEPDVRLRLDAATCTALVVGTLTVADAVRGGWLKVAGDGALARTLLAWA